MKLAFCLFNYFPYGGLQRDFLRIALACQQRGHEIHVFTLSWRDNIPANFNLHFIKARGFSNHARCRSYARQLPQHLAAEHFDVVIGFNRMPGLDIYFAADLCYQHQIRTQRPWWYRLMPRYRDYVALEQAVFSPDAKTHILLLTAAEQLNFIRYYQTPNSRFHLLPPGISPDRAAPSNAAEIRLNFRSQLHFNSHQLLILMIATRFKTKGLDRALYALANLPSELLSKTHLLIVGDDKPKPYLKLAAQLNVSQHVHFLGGRSDIPNFLFAADILLHPAYREAAGMALLEAIVAGLPVLTTANCGYAFHIAAAHAGLLVDMPFSQDELNQKLHDMLTSPEKTIWKKNALAYAAEQQLFSLPEKAADFIESVGSQQ